MSSNCAVAKFSFEVLGLSKEESGWPLPICHLNPEKDSELLEDKNYSIQLEYLSLSQKQSIIWFWCKSHCQENLRSSSVDSPPCELYSSIFTHIHPNFRWVTSSQLATAALQHGWCLCHIRGTEGAAQGLGKRFRWKIWEVEKSNRNRSKQIETAMKKGWTSYTSYTSWTSWTMNGGMVECPRYWAWALRTQPLGPWWSDGSSDQSSAFGSWGLQGELYGMNHGASRWCLKRKSAYTGCKPNLSRFRAALALLHTNCKHPAVSSGSHAKPQWARLSAPTIIFMNFHIIQAKMMETIFYILNDGNDLLHSSYHIHIQSIWNL